ncbi:MAG: hypothetical protein AB9872_03845 [Solidesulfovibrio sp.]
MYLLTILLLAAAVIQTRMTDLRRAIAIILIQSAFLAIACTVVGLQSGHMHMYVAAVLTVIIKVGLIPYALYKVLPYLYEEREVPGREIVKANMSTLLSVLAIIIAYGLVNPVIPSVAQAQTLPASISLVLIGFVLIMTRSQAVMQIIGLITMENGLYLLGLTIANGLPLIIELGIFFDVLVAVVVLVILTYRLKLSFLSTDTSLLKKLKG